MEIATRPDWKKWEPHELALLGTRPDGEIAEQLGRSYRSVQAKRKRLRIRTHRQKQSASGARK